VSERLEAIIQASNAVKQEQRALKLLMNAPQFPLDEFPILWPATDPEVAPLDLHPDRLTEVALAQRMELLELELQLAADAATIAFEENQALPLFTLDYTYRVNGLGGNLSESAGILQDNDFNDWALSLTLEQPIGNDAAEARVAQAIITRLQRLSTRQARRLTIEREVRDAVDNIQAGWQRILASRQSAILAGRTLEAEQRQFDVGRSTSTDVLDAATRLADAQLAEIRALTEYQISKVDLAFATGSILGASLVEWEPIDPRPVDDDDSRGAPDPA
jgi:outer membrane protein TolC